MLTVTTIHACLTRAGRACFTPPMAVGGTQRAQPRAKRAPTRDELAKVAADWLRQRGLPLFVRQPERPRLPVLVVNFAKDFGVFLFWAVGHPFREARQTTRVLAGAIPFLLLTLAFLLLTNELWIVSAHLSTAEFIGAISLFAFFGIVLFVFEAIRIERAAEFDQWTKVRRAMHLNREQPVAPIEALVEDCMAHANSLGPAAHAWLAARLTAAAAADPSDEPDIDREQKLLSADPSASQEEMIEFLRVSRWPELPEIEPFTDLHFPERLNITFLVAFALSVQVLAVGIVMGIFFLVFGRLAVDEDTLADWKVKSHDGWLGWSTEHWEVSALLAAFAGLSYVVSVALFKEQRELFLGELDRKVKQRLAVGALNRALRQK